MNKCFIIWCMSLGQFPKILSVFVFPPSYTYFTGMRVHRTLYTTTAEVEPIQLPFSNFIKIYDHVKHMASDPSNTLVQACISKGFCRKISRLSEKRPAPHIRQHSLARCHTVLEVRLPHCTPWLWSRVRPAQEPSGKPCICDPGPCG